MDLKSLLKLFDNPYEDKKWRPHTVLSGELLETWKDLESERDDILNRFSRLNHRRKRFWLDVEEAIGEHDKSLRVEDNIIMIEEE